MVPTQTAAETKDVLFGRRRFCEKEKAKVSTSGCQPARGSQASVNSPYATTVQVTYSIDQSSVVDGEVAREDHASAVMRVPMWKLAMDLHEVGVCLNKFSARNEDESGTLLRSAGPQPNVHLL